MAQRVLKPLLDYEPGVFLTRDQKMSADELVSIVKKIESKLAHYRRQRDKTTRRIASAKIKLGRPIEEILFSSSDDQVVEYEPSVFMRSDEAMKIDNLNIVKIMIVSKLASYRRQKLKALKRLSELRKKGRVNYVWKHVDDLSRDELRNMLASIAMDDEKSKKKLRSKRPSFVVSDVDQEVSSDEHEQLEEDLFLSDESD